MQVGAAYFPATCWYFLVDHACLYLGWPLFLISAAPYKFFISFENGDCDDYISEKFWRHIEKVRVGTGHKLK